MGYEDVVAEDDIVGHVKTNGGGATLVVGWLVSQSLALSMFAMCLFAQMQK